MEMSVSLLRSYLAAHHRNLARAYPLQAVISSWTMLPQDVREANIARWATIARDEPLEVDMPRPDGVKVVKEEDISNWIRTHGRGIPRRATVNG